MPSQHKLRVTWTRSTIGTPARHRATVRALGLHKLHQTVFHDDSPSLRGMLHAVRHLVTVAPVTEEEFAAATTRVAKPPAFILRSGPPADAPVKAKRPKRGAKPAAFERAAAATTAKPEAAAAVAPLQAAPGAGEKAAAKPKRDASAAAKTAEKPKKAAAAKAPAKAKAPVAKAKASAAAKGEAKPSRPRAAAAKSKQEPKA
jgi:ribosomal protein L30